MKSALLLLSLTLPAFAADIPVPAGQPAAEYEDLADAMKCFWPMPVQGVAVVRDQEAFAKLAGRPNGSRACQAAGLPKIDFTKQTVLGIYAQGGGCKINFSRYVSRNDAAKRVILYGVVLTQGACEMAGISMNWVAVPLVPEDYMVTGSVMVSRQ